MTSQECLLKILYETLIIIKARMLRPSALNAYFVIICK